jgi:hypothetical protein
MEGFESMAIPHKVRPLEAAILADQISEASPQTNEI